MSGVEYRVVRAGGYNNAAAETAMTDVLNKAAADGWRVAARPGDQRGDLPPGRLTRPTLPRIPRTWT
jgi:hypothetical protein